MYATLRGMYEHTPIIMSFVCHYAMRPRDNDDNNNYYIIFIIIFPSL